MNCWSRNERTASQASPRLGTITARTKTSATFFTVWPDHRRSCRFRPELLTQMQPETAEACRAFELPQWHKTADVRSLLSPGQVEYRPKPVAFFRLKISSRQGLLEY